MVFGNEGVPEFIFTVSLAGPDDKKPVPLLELPRVKDAMEVASRFARVLGVTVTDATENEPREWDPSVAVEIEQFELDIPPSPADSRIVVELEPKSVILKLPMCGFAFNEISHVVGGSAILLLTPFLVSWPVLRMFTEKELERWGYMAAATIPCFLLGFAFIIQGYVRARTSFVIELSPTELVVVRKYGLWRKQRLIPYEKIDSFLIPPRSSSRWAKMVGGLDQSLVVYGLDRPLIIGRNLKRSELEWLLAVVSECTKIRQVAAEVDPILN